MAEPDRAAYEAAERLVREAHARAEEAARAIPPNGWSSGAAPDVSSLFALVEAARGVIPPELARQLADALRDLLVAIRAVLDYSIERLERAPAPERQVEDIPIQ
jgi:hypothetical protein